jgi:hypothetical protein
MDGADSGTCLNNLNDKRKENLNEIIYACNDSREKTNDLISRITF